jgi:hypothetical protein
MFIGDGIKYWTVNDPNEIGQKVCDLAADYDAGSIPPVTRDAEKM